MPTQAIHTFNDTNVSFEQLWQYSHHIMSSLCHSTAHATNIGILKTGGVQIHVITQIQETQEHSKVYFMDIPLYYPVKGELYDLYVHILIYVLNVDTCTCTCVCILRLQAA